MGRELMDADVRRQAAACIEHGRRGGDMRRWCESKAFTPDDLGAVLREIGRQLRASGRGEDVEVPR